MADPVTGLLVTTSLVSGLLGNNKARKASRANRRANDLESQRRGIQNSLARRKALAERRRLQAQIQAEALATGVGLSSGADAASASVDAQIASDIAGQTQLEEIDQARDVELKRAGKLNQQARNLDQFGQFAAGFGSFFD